MVKKSHNGIVEDCRKVIITRWMITNDYPSWRSLCLALCAVSVGHQELAKRIGELHPIKLPQQCNEPADEASSSQSAIPPTRAASIPSLSTSRSQHPSYLKPVEVSQRGSVLSKTSDVYQEPDQQKSTGSGADELV